MKTWAAMLRRDEGVPPLSRSGIRVIRDQRVPTRSSDQFRVATT